MRPIKLTLENFGPYRERAEVDFSSLGEFFLICGKTGSGKSTLFDGIAYALFGQAPGARKGHEADLASGFSNLGDRPSAEFEFALSGTRYRAARTAPYRRPKRGGGVVEAPPSATLFVADTEAEGGWRVLADGVRDTNEKVPALVGLTAEEFSKIILLPQGEFQRFLEMESTDRSAVLEKLFPVELDDAITEIAKRRTQEARASLAALQGEIGRLSGELGEAPDERLAALESELAAAESGEAAALAEAAARARELEGGRERAARAARALDASKALAALEERRSQEDAREKRIASARAAAAVAPAIQAFEKARAKALEDRDAAAAASARLAKLLESGPAMEAARTRAAECAPLIVVARDEVFRLNKAAEVWKRREAALDARSAAGARSKSLDEELARMIADSDRLRKEIEGLRSEPAEESRIRADLERLVAADSGLSLLAEKNRRRISLFAEAEKRARSYADLEKARGERLSEKEKAASALAAIEAELAHSEAIRLAASLKPGEPCPVCGSRSHPAPASMALDFGAPSPGEAGEARARLLALSGEVAGLEADAGHAAARIAETASELEALGTEIAAAAAEIARALAEAESLPKGEEPAAFDALAGSSDGKAAAAFAEKVAAIVALNRKNVGALREKIAGFERARAEIANREKALAQGASRLEQLRAESGRAKAELVERTTILAEAERESGAEDPAPRRDAAVERLAGLEAEKASLEAERYSWAEKVTSAQATAEALGRERAKAYAGLKADFARLVESLSRAGYLASAEVSARAAEKSVVAAATEAAAEKSAAISATLAAIAAEALLGEIRVEAGEDFAAALARAASLFMAPETLAGEEKAAAAYREALAAARAKAASLEADLPAPGQEPPDLAALEASAERARADVAAARSRSDASRLSLNRLQDALARRVAAEKRRDEQEESSRSLYRLSELLSGDMAGRHLTFKNYVLAMYFREVARRASVHLSRMSDGRYYLKPDEGQASGRGKIGLGLKVLDSWTGADRPTTTLSGGEKFLTSISLALGLADSLRDRNGGVSLDAVFIDEGFGSLDDEALDRAIEVLDKIRGSRVIGIVSHVAGLRARIPSRIEVERTASGSRLSQTNSVPDDEL